jgi:hypothetical protein
MRSANAQFWGALRGLLLEAELGGVPETLVFERGPVPARLEAATPRKHWRYRGVTTPSIYCFRMSSCPEV